jgi:thioredoxin reductase
MTKIQDRGNAWAVVGTGPHGLSALKALLQVGIDADAFERESDIGGNWNYHGSNSRVYRSTHLISTKPFTQFPDFPMPDDYPDYPSHWQVHEYFHRYAEHFGLTEHIAFNTEVVNVEPVPDSTRWLVTTKSGRSKRTQEYAGVVIANGHNWSPKTPTYPGLELFSGEILHSAQYKGPDAIAGKRVLVVGAGNTGCDIAVESAQNAVQTWHSTRRGYYYNPKYAFGRPSDQTADLLLALKLPLAVRRVLFGATLRLTVGDFTRYGLRKPDHKFFETHPIVNQQLVYYIGHGDITPKPDIARFTADSVEFTDGTAATPDVVVFCTGYLAVFPFLPSDTLPMAGDHPELPRHMFVPGHPTLAVSGLIQPDSGQWTIAHWQAMTIAKYAHLREINREKANEFFTEVCASAGHRYTGGAEYKDSTRHYYEVAHQVYLKALEDDIAFLDSAMPITV